MFALFGLKSPFLWGVIMGLLAFLPILGIGGVFVPTAAYLFLQGRIGAGIFFLIFYIVLSSSIEYFFKPKLVGRRVRMHTLIVFLSIIGGLKLFGILGIISAVDRTGTVIARCQCSGVRGQNPKVRGIGESNAGT